MYNLWITLGGGGAVGYRKIVTVPSGIQKRSKLGKKRDIHKYTQVIDLHKENTGAPFVLTQAVKGHTG